MMIGCTSTDLRHTFASWLVHDGVRLYEVQKLPAHSSIAVTQVYSPPVTFLKRTEQPGKEIP